MNQAPPLDAIESMVAQMLKENSELATLELTEPKGLVVFTLGDNAAVLTEILALPGFDKETS